jgi:small conductance mechanosensitive channel
MVVVVALDKFGVQTAPLVAGIGIAGLGIGIALQGVFGNVIAGLTIIFTKPFRVGEYIELLGVHGQVTAIELFSTTLIHTDLSRVVIPNRKIVGEVLHNFGNVRQLTIKVGVAYGTNLNAALALVRDITSRNPRILKEPPAVVGVSVLGDSAITISIQPWVAVPDYVDAQVELYQSIIEGFRTNKIEIPFPQREVRLLPAS